MSFTGDIRLEVTEKTPDSPCCRLSALTGMLLLGGHVTFMGTGRYQATISSEHASVIRYADRLARLSANLAGEFIAVHTNQLGERTKYQLTFRNQDAVALLKALSLWDENAPFCVSGKPDPGLFRRTCCRQSSVRGAFLVCGWVSPPQEGYRAELAAPDEKQAQQLRRVLSRCGISARLAQRKTQHVVYFQDGEAVSTFLKVLGATRAVLDMEDARAMREVRNTVNRKVNCEVRNMDATITAAQRQVEDIQYLQEHMGLDRLPAPLRQMAEARLNNMEANLSELGELLDPPIGKSGVNNRLRRLSALADRERAKRGEMP